MSEKLVKVKILKNVGPYTQGQEVEVLESQAKSMCEVRKMHNGYGLVDYRTAMTMDEFEKIKAIPVDMGGLTVDEAVAMGLKNVTPTPKAELERPFHPGFSESKDPAEGYSAKQAQEINANNPHNKKRAS